MTRSEAGGPGLSAGELALVLGELAADLAGAEVTDAARLRDRDDLLLYVRRDDARSAIQIAPGGARARLAPTSRRFPGAAFATGPHAERLRRLLRGTRVGAVTWPEGERRCRIELARPGEPESLALAVELFGPRGLWCVLDPEDTILIVSRPARRGGVELGIGGRYHPPPPPPRRTEEPPRFRPPVAAAVDAHFTALDLAEEHDRRRQALRRALDRASRKQRARLAQLAERHGEIGGAADLRLQADLLLAYGFGASGPELVVPHPQRPDDRVRIPREPGVPVQVQAERLYRRARKLERGTEIAARRRVEAEQLVDFLESVTARLDAAREDADLDAIERELEERGLGPPRPRDPRPPQPRTKLDKAARDENLRRFTSAEGYPILVGRSNAQNDRLTTRIARGNDLWLHVGENRAGSHVVVRLPRGKTPSLETLLDAGTLAVHFSKARGTPRCDVLYTHAKHVRKPKGAPAGRVLPSHTKTVTVRLDRNRLQRLLGGDDA